MKKLTIIAGLCSLENLPLTNLTVDFLKRETSKYPEIDFIFKASYKKANRTKLKSYTGVGLDEGIKIFNRIKQTKRVKILTDVHTIEEAVYIASCGVADIIQIPAFLCRQTELILAIARNAEGVNIKKGQFISPHDVKYIVEKVESTGNKNIMITERGTCFGYNNLVVDFRSFAIMKKLGYPIIFDVTHSLQLPSGDNGITGGDKKFALSLAKGAVATGNINGLFFECHPDPKKAKSDSATSLNFDEVRQLLEEVIPIRRVING